MLWPGWDFIGFKGWIGTRKSALVYRKKDLRFLDLHRFESNWTLSSLPVGFKLNGTVALPSDFRTSDDHQPNTQPIAGRTDAGRGTEPPLDRSAVPGTRLPDGKVVGPRCLRTSLDRYELEHRSHRRDQVLPSPSWRQLVAPDPRSPKPRLDVRQPGDRPSPRSRLGFRTTLLRDGIPRKRIARRSDPKSRSHRSPTRRRTLYRNRHGFKPLPRKRGPAL